MNFEFVNRICPNCKNPNYMVLLGDLSKVYKYKCMNCNRYFNDIDFEKEPIQQNALNCLNVIFYDDNFIQNINKINKNIAHQQIIHKWARFALQNNIKDIFTPERVEAILSWTDETIAVLKEHLFCAETKKEED